MRELEDRILRQREQRPPDQDAVDCPRQKSTEISRPRPYRTAIPYTDMHSGNCRRAACAPWHSGPVESSAMPASSSSEPPFIAFEMTFSCAPCPAHPRTSPATLLRWARLRCASAPHTRTCRSPWWWPKRTAGAARAGSASTSLRAAMVRPAGPNGGGHCASRAGPTPAVSPEAPRMRTPAGSKRD